MEEDDDDDEEEVPRKVEEKGNQRQEGGRRGGDDKENADNITSVPDRKTRQSSRIDTNVVNVSTVHNTVERLLISPTAFNKKYVWIINFLPQCFLIL